MCGAKEEMTLGDDSCTKTKNPSVFNQGVQVHGDAAEMPPRLHRVLAEIVLIIRCVCQVWWPSDTNSPKVGAGG